MYLPTFQCYKIDYQIAGKSSNDKLMEIGLMYGDMLAFRQVFGNGSTEQFVSYGEMAAELKKKTKRNHVFGRKINDKPIKAPQTIKVTFGLKCLEHRVYVAKRNKGFSHDLDRTATYYTPMLKIMLRSRKRLKHT